MPVEARASARRRMLVLCPYPVGVAPSQRLKYEQYFDYFVENGYDLTVSPFMTLGFWRIAYQKGHLLQKIAGTFWGYARRVLDLLRAPRYDVVYVHLWVTPFGPPLFERLLMLRTSRVVYDIDDLVFLAPTNRVNRLIGPLKGRRKAPFLMRAARHTIVCTPHLDQYARQFSDRTTDISSTIDMKAYARPVMHRDKPNVTLGWSGSHSTSKYLRLIEPVLRDVVARTGASVLVIGDPNFRFDSLACEVLPWSAEREVQDLSRIDIGLYPLPDEEWVLGKSGLKALQYMALGIPTVATAVGANFRVIEDGVSGFLVRNESEWRDRLTRLAQDHELRARIGAAARQRVIRDYSVEANRDRYLSILETVAR